MSILILLEIYSVKFDDDDNGADWSKKLQQKTYILPIPVWICQKVNTNVSMAIKNQITHNRYLKCKGTF
jgi:hypothetical protein